jgi:Flp pilus assembly protein TadD
MLLHGALAVTALQRLRADEPIDVALSVAVLAYMIQQQFLFPLAELDPVLWVFAGLLVARRPHRRSYPAPLFRTVSGSRRAVMFGAGFLAAMSAIAGLSDVAADHAVAELVDTSGVEALRTADIARSRRPDSVRYDFIAARAALRSDTPDSFTQALERLDAGLRISPTDPAFLQERAAVLLEIARRSDERSDLDNALDAFDLLEEEDPNHPDSELGHGITLALAGDLDAARLEFEHAAALSPQSVDALLNLAILEFEADNTSDGAAVLDRVDVISPTNADAAALRREFLRE